MGPQPICPFEPGAITMILAHHHHQGSRHLHHHHLRLASHLHLLMELVPIREVTHQCNRPIQVISGHCTERRQQRPGLNIIKKHPHSSQAAAIWQAELTCAASCHICTSSEIELCSTPANWRQGICIRCTASLAIRWGMTHLDGGHCQCDLKQIGTAFENAIHEAHAVARGLLEHMGDTMILEVTPRLGRLRFNLVQIMDNLVSPHKVKLIQIEDRLTHRSL